MDSNTINTLLQHALQHISAQAWALADGFCQQALALDPHHAEAHHLAGHVAGQMGNHDRSLAYLAQAISLSPRHPQYRYNYAVSLALWGKDNEAAVQYQACLRYEPNHRDALWNYGEMLRMAEHFELAAALFERFAANGAVYPSLNHRLGVVYGALKKDKLADAHFLRELNAGQPQADALTQWEYSLYLLSRERFREGFAYYQKRFSAGGRNSVFCHDFGLPLWQGSFTPNSTLLVHGEQGLGDEMMFASIVPELLSKAKQSQSRVVLAVKPALVRLFALSFPAATVVAHRVDRPLAHAASLGKVDWHITLGDLAVLFRAELQDFEPARQAYLFAEAERTQGYGQQLALLQVKPAKLRVGLMWGSNPAAVNAKFVRWSQQRSIPIQLFDQIFKHYPDLLAQVQFVSLQNAERGHEAGLAAHLDVLDLSALQTDFLETASLIANLDLVISVDTSVAHLAGAMGVETWVPLMHKSDWRHGDHRAKSYWYANTVYFHQPASGDWLSVLNSLAQALTQRLAQTPSAKEEDAKNAQALREDLAKASNYLAVRDFANARIYFERALALAPDNPKIRWEYAMQLLTTGDWGRGWDYHEARFSIFGLQGLHICPLPWPQWRGEPLLGKTIVVHGEQGIGDEIMYLSMLPDVVATGANVILACAPSLVQLFQHSFASIKVVPHARGAGQNWHIALPAWAQPSAIGQVDFQIPIASLGAQWRRKAADFPRQAYLRVDPELSIKMASVLQAISSKTYSKRIGLAWCGSLGDANARARSVAIERFKPLIELGKAKNWQFVSLQSRQYSGQIDAVPSFELVDMSAHTDDFADLAALMTNLDLIISIDTSYAHLSAALGVPTWRMVIRTCDWRWGWGRDDSVWYPNDRLFRQKKDGDWDEVIKRVAIALKKWQ